MVLAMSWDLCALKGIVPCAFVPCSACGETGPSEIIWVAVMGGGGGGGAWWRLRPQPPFFTSPAPVVPSQVTDRGLLPE